MHITSKIIKSIVKYLIIIVALLVTLLPIYWMLITSFKTMNEIFQRVPTFFPMDLTFENYSSLFKETTYLHGIWNSFSIAIVVACFTIAISLPASYAISRLRFKMKKIASNAVLFTYLIPAAVLYIPLFIMMTNLHLTNSKLGLMLIYPTFTIPYATWILIPYLKSIPLELEEAAIVDGCSRAGSMLKIVFPLAAPGIITTFVFSFIQCWGEFLYALVNITEAKMRTFPLVINALIWGDLYPWGQIMAGGIIACIPVLILYTSCSNLIVNGLTSGSVKQ